MTVAELIEALKEMPQDKEVIMFDESIYYTPTRVFIWNENGEVVIE